MKQDYVNGLVISIIVMFFCLKLFERSGDPSFMLFYPLQFNYQPLGFYHKLHHDRNDCSGSESPRRKFGSVPTEDQIRDLLDKNPQ